MWFRSVKFVGPFCYLIIAFFVINKIRTKVVQKVKRIVDAILWNREMLCDFSVHCYHSPWKAKCASTTKSTTSSVAEQSNCSQNQSKHSSAGNIVSNMKSCRSCRFWVEKRFVCFILIVWQILGGFSTGLVPVPQVVFMLYFPPTIRDNNLLPL